MVPVTFTDFALVAAATGCALTLLGVTEKVVAAWQRFVRRRGIRRHRRWLEASRIPNPPWHGCRTGDSGEHRLDRPTRSIP
jgi:hypothetical protein